MTESAPELENIVEIASAPTLEQTLPKCVGKAPEIILYYATEPAYVLFDERSGAPQTNVEVIAFSAIPLDDSPFLLTIQDFARIASERNYTRVFGDINATAKTLRQKNNFLCQGIVIAKKRKLIESIPGLTNVQKSILRFILGNPNANTKNISQNLNKPYHTVRAAAKSLEIRNFIEIYAQNSITGGKESIYRVHEPNKDIIDLLITRNF